MEKGFLGNICTIAVAKHTYSSDTSVKEEKRYGVRDEVSQPK